MRSNLYLIKLYLTLQIKASSLNCASHAFVINEPDNLKAWLQEKARTAMRTVTGTRMTAGIVLRE